MVQRKVRNFSCGCGSDRVLHRELREVWRRWKYPYWEIWEITELCLEKFMRVICIKEEGKNAT